MSGRNRVGRGLAIPAIIHEHGLRIPGLRPMTTLVTGAGLIGTAFAQNALARGETVVFVDPEPRADFLRSDTTNPVSTMPSGPRIRD